MSMKLVKLLLCTRLGYSFVHMPMRRSNMIAMRSVSSVSETLPPALKAIVTNLQNLPDDKYRYKQLLFWASQASSIDTKFRIPENKVPGCLSTVYVHATIDPDTRLVTYIGDSDAQLTKGLVNLLVKGLSGNTPEAINKVDPAFIREAGIAASLTPGRNSGFVNMLNVMKAKALALESEEQTIQTADVKKQTIQEEARGPIATEILNKLAVLQPTSIELVDESHQHAGHAGAKGFEAGESHFKLDIVADCFDDLSRVKRHQLIYTILGDIMQQIHALQIFARSPSEKVSS
mmetsp:Transcript_3149/g.4372  ORF Transcript_3149/g.4372 Transcript_3149/m.4372 type:complete len:290 (+) Transcript_3149:100-969(+)